MFSLSTSPERSFQDDSTPAGRAGSPGWRGGSRQMRGQRECSNTAPDPGMFAERPARPSPTDGASSVEKHRNRSTIRGRAAQLKEKNIYVEPKVAASLLARGKKRWKNLLLAVIV